MNLGLTITIVIVAVVVVAALLVLINIKTKKSRLLKTISGLENQKLEIMKTPVNAKLIKISLIGKNNVVFDSIFQENKAIFDNIMNEYSTSLNETIESARKECMDGQYKRCSEIIKDIHIRLTAFKGKMDDLDQKLNEVLKDENDIKSKANLLRNKFSEALNMFTQYKAECNFNVDQYEKLIKNIEEKFRILNEYTNRGSYRDAFDLIEVLNKSVTFLHNNLEIAPNKVKRVIVTLPNELNAIIDKYNMMQQEKYPLYNITANQKIIKIKEDLKVLIGELQNFNYDGIDERIDTLEDKVKVLKEALYKEEDARTNFENDNKSIYDKASSLESKYLEIIREHDEFRKMYVDKNKELDTLRDTIKFDVNDLNAIRRSLDSLNYGEQPYSMRLSKLNELKTQSDKVEADIKKYKDYAIFLRDVCEYSNGSIESSATTLKKLELKIRNSKVTRLAQIYSEHFARGYELVQKLEDIFRKQPIDVASADSLSKKLDELTNDLKENCEKDLALLNKAEKLLMYTAQFKRDFGDFESAHIRAEGFFYECRFQNCIDTLLDATKAIHVDIPFEVKGENE